MLKEEWMKDPHEKIGNDFSFYGTLCLLFGIIFAYSLNQNPYGLAVLLFVLIGYGVALLVLSRLEVKIKKDSYFLIVVSVLIGAANCRSSSDFFVFFNRAALILLNAVFWIHQCYQEESWNIGKYTSAVGQLMVQIVSLIFVPFRHFSVYITSIKDEKYKNVLLVCKGVVLAIPLVIVAALLLSVADLVFQDILSSLIISFFDFDVLVPFIIRFLIGSVMAYALICAISGKGINEELKDKRRKEPVVAITALSMVGIIYIMFSGIQIVYLFMGKGTLPEGVTYAEYARQGFFQLVFVAVLNLCLVLSCIKYYKHSKILNLVLTGICICTYVMIASAAYRMILYIGEYHLTLLRILVLWFLVTLSILMVGVIAIIHKNDVPLFRYCLAVVSVCYLCLAWMRPDYVIAEYNVSKISEFTMSEVYDLTNLSSDAAPVLRMLDSENLTEEMQHRLDRYFSYYMDLSERMSWRTYNVSLAQVSE